MLLMNFWSVVLMGSWLTLDFTLGSMSHQQGGEEAWWRVSEVARAAEFFRLYPQV
jgi:hypothetical protein